MPPLSPPPLIPAPDTGITADLTHYLHILRIPADVRVVSLDFSDMGAYGTDWTIRRQKRDAGGRTPGRSQPSLASLFVDPRSTEPLPSVKEEGKSTGLGLGLGSESGVGLGLGLGQPTAAEAPRPAAASHQDDQGHVRIRRAIVEHSSDAALVLINLPPPPKTSWADPLSYFQLVEYLTTGLSRVVYVYGSGAEVLSHFI